MADANVKDDEGIPESQGADEVVWNTIEDVEAKTSYVPVIYTKHYGVCMAMCVKQWLWKWVEENMLKQEAQPYITSSFWEAGDNAIGASASTGFMKSMIKHKWAKTKKEHNKTFYQLTDLGRRYAARFVLIPPERRKPPPAGKWPDDWDNWFYKTIFKDCRLPKNYIAEYKRLKAKGNKRKSLPKFQPPAKRKRKRPIGRAFQPYHFPCQPAPSVIVPEENMATTFLYQFLQSNMHYVELGILKLSDRALISPLVALQRDTVLAMTFPVHPYCLQAEERYMVLVRLEAEKKDYRTQMIRGYTFHRGNLTYAPSRSYVTSFDRVIYNLATIDLEEDLRNRFDVIAQGHQDSKYKIGEKKERYILPDNLLKNKIGIAAPPRGIFACDYEAILVVMMRLKENFRRTEMKRNEKELFRCPIPEEIIIYEADRICEENVSRNYAKKKSNPLKLLANNVWIKTCSPPKFPGMTEYKLSKCYVLTEAGEKKAKEIVTRNRNHNTRALPDLQKVTPEEEVYFEESERCVYGWTIWENHKQRMGAVPKRRLKPVSDENDYDGVEPWMKDDDQKKKAPKKKKKKAKSKAKKKSSCPELDDDSWMDDELSAPKPVLPSKPKKQAEERFDDDAWMGGDQNRAKSKPQSSFPPEVMKRRNSAPPQLQSPVGKKPANKQKPVKGPDPKPKAKKLGLCSGVKNKENQEVVDQIWKLGEFHKARKNYSRARTFSYAAGEIAQVEYKITIENAKNLTKIQGVKKGTLKRVMEFLQSGELREMQPDSKQDLKRNDSLGYQPRCSGVKNAKNAPVVDKLEALSQFYRNKKPRADYGRANTFKKSAGLLAQLTWEVTLENAKDITKINGIANGTLKRVKEFLSTGRLKEMDGELPPSAPPPLQAFSSPVQVEKQPKTSKKKKVKSAPKPKPPTVKRAVTNPVVQKAPQKKSQPIKRAVTNPVVRKAPKKKTKPVIEILESTQEPFSDDDSDNELLGNMTKKPTLMPKKRSREESPKLNPVKPAKRQRKKSPAASIASSDDEDDSIELETNTPPKKIIPVAKKISSPSPKPSVEPFEAPKPMPRRSRRARQKRKIDPSFEYDAFGFDNEAKQKPAKPPAPKPVQKKKADLRRHSNPPEENFADDEEEYGAEEYAEDDFDGQLRKAMEASMKTAEAEQKKRKPQINKKASPQPSEKSKFVEKTPPKLKKQISRPPSAKVQKVVLAPEKKVEIPPIDDETAAKVFKRVPIGEEKISWVVGPLKNDKECERPNLYWNVDCREKMPNMKSLVRLTAGRSIFNGLKRMHIQCKHLHIYTGLADYVLSFGFGNQVYFLPILFERKTIQDLADSMKSGKKGAVSRLNRQLCSMEYVIGKVKKLCPSLAKYCSITIILEGMLHEQLVNHNGRERVGRSSGPLKESWEKQVEMLEEHVHVEYTNYMAHTLVYLRDVMNNIDLEELYKTFIELPQKQKDIMMMHVWEENHQFEKRASVKNKTHPSFYDWERIEAEEKSARFQMNQKRIAEARAQRKAREEIQNEEAQKPVEVVVVNPPNPQAHFSPPPNPQVRFPPPPNPPAARPAPPNPVNDVERLKAAVKNFGFDASTKFSDTQIQQNINQHGYENAVNVIAEVLICA